MNTVHPVKTKPLTENLSFRIEKAILETLDKLAAREDRKRADVARRIFVKALQRETAK